MFIQAAQKNIPNTSTRHAPDTCMHTAQNDITNISTQNNQTREYTAQKNVTKTPKDIHQILELKQNKKI
jgi:hypothetical protein